MARPAWSGFLRLSLVSVPVQAFTAEVPNSGQAVFHQLHAECHSRIKYKKACPIHGEVSNDEIVSAYEYEKGRYVIFDDDEIKELKGAAAGAGQGITIETFVPTSEIDPRFFEGRNYYLLPDGEAGEAPYALLRQAMHDDERCGFAQAVLWGHKRLVLIRPGEKLLMMSLMRFASQSKPAAEFEDQAPDYKPRTDELRLAKRLIAETSEDEIDWNEYKDEYARELQAVVDAKVSGETVVSPEQVDEPPVLSLIDALKRSVHKPKHRHEKAARSKKQSSSPRRTSQGGSRRKSAG